MALQEFSYPGFILESMPPSDCHEALLSGKADLGLCPIVLLQESDGFQRIGNFGICSRAYVYSVGVFSNTPIDKIHKIYLDTESRTSVSLLKWLCKNHWNISPAYENLAGSSGNHHCAQGEGTLLIGNKAILAHGKYSHYYDLVGSWREATGLPFVFAAWIGKKNIAHDFIRSFDAVQNSLFHHPEKILLHPEAQMFGETFTRKYLMEYISYSIGNEERKAIDFFLNETKLFPSR